MRRIIVLVLVLFTVLIIPVNAASAWPKSFTEGEYTYSIEGVVLNVYEIQESFDDFSQKYTYDVSKKRTIDLSAEDYTINPTYTKTMINSIDSLLININLNITKDKLEQLLQNEINDAIGGKSYDIDMSVKYKFTNYPSKYKDIYKVDINHDETKYTEVQIPPQFGKEPVKKINLSETNEQVINMMRIVPYNQKEENNLNGKGELVYSKNPGPSSSEIYMDYISLYENTRTSNSDTPSFIIMFHNIDNIEQLIAPSSSEQTSVSQQGNEVVKVEDTASSFPIILYIISVVLLLFGSIILVYSVEKQKNNQNI